MIADLKQKLRELRTNRLINYGNVAYQKISGDLHFESVPSELRELWHSQDVVSFRTQYIAYDSDIDYMSHNELVRWIDNEHCLIARLESIFSSLESQKEGSTRDQN